MPILADYPEHSTECVAGAASSCSSWMTKPCRETQRGILSSQWTLPPVQAWLRSEVLALTLRPRRLHAPHLETSQWARCPERSIGCVVGATSSFWTKASWKQLLPLRL